MVVYRRLAGIALFQELQNYSIPESRRERDVRLERYAIPLSRGQQPAKSGDARIASVRSHQNWSCHLVANNIHFPVAPVRFIDASDQCVFKYLRTGSTSSLQQEMIKHASFDGDLRIIVSGKRHAHASPADSDK